MRCYGKKLLLVNNISVSIHGDIQGKTGLNTFVSYHQGRINVTI